MINKYIYICISICISICINVWKPLHQFISNWMVVLTTCSDAFSRIKLQLFWVKKFKPRTRINDKTSLTKVMVRRLSVLNTFNMIFFVRLSTCPVLQILCHGKHSCKDTIISNLQARSILSGEWLIRTRIIIPRQVITQTSGDFSSIRPTAGTHFYSQFTHFDSRKYHWSFRLSNRGHFVLVQNACATPCIWQNNDVTRALHMIASPITDN